ncbi:uncharacterized protein LOC129945071 [Eupeodes corollae]|uniref:uncharacterized protein LOC129945071 n=1 Tax=Eupeodes corollae TaxID=290404 RepID=UPI0024907BAF|nr:uncharacterized protein LOC129945071 [Eupeodes corollae]
MASCGICTADEALDQQIERFWRLEETTAATDNNFTQAEKRCETHFIQTTTRDSIGRFVVWLPFKEAPTCLGESKDIAFRRFIALERRLANSPDLKKLYKQFIEEYLQLGHMQEVSLSQIAKPYYFLPHHCIQKPDSSTTKLRVVFDASAKTSTNLSLYDILSTGPTIQDDVFSMLLRFRMPRYVFTTDIEKIYRQELINEEDQQFQLIWWRSSSNDALKCFKLQTVTYGTTSASYLATKCLQALAQDNKKRFPLGSTALLRSFYVDDVLTGSDKIAELMTTPSEWQTILQQGSFKLRKWCANHASILKGILLEDRETELDFSSNVDEHIKTVGLTWMPKSDQLCVKTSWIEKVRATKRSAYSDIAHLFDPLGIKAPVSVVAKIFLQKLWELKLDWDATLPQEMQTTWLKYRKGLQSLNNIKIDRHIFSHRSPKNIQYHIFADASEKAYGAAVYVRSVNSDNSITVLLLCSKSRVAPSKQTKLAQQATIPRLELCAACLATELLLRLQKDLKIHNEATFLWTDSEIVFA